ncbi:MAG: hypothetical protein M3N29_09080 [Chloroflexota bacterium]|nr:hypothetical protein [Chloroflexota bacterium]
MEMEFKDPSARRRRLLLVVGLVTALIAGFAAYQMSAGGTGAAAPPETTQVVVVTREVPPRTVLAAGDVALREVPVDPSVETAARATEVVVGRMTAVTMLPGQVVYPNLLVTTTEGAPFSILAPGETIAEDTPHWRAVAVMVPRDRAVGGDILAGQHIDLIVSVAINVFRYDEEGNLDEMVLAGNPQSGESTKITYQDLEVLEARTTDSIYILKMDLRQAEEVSHISKVAPNSFSLVLRPDGDGRQVETYDYGVTHDRLIMKYLYPVPLVLDVSLLPGGNGEAVVAPGPVLSSPDPDAPPESPAPDAPAESPAPEPAVPTPTAAP